MERLEESGSGGCPTEERGDSSIQEKLKQKYQIPVTADFFGKYSLNQLGLNECAIMTIFPNGEIYEGILKEGRVVERPGIIKYATFPELSHPNSAISFSVDVENLLAPSNSHFSTSNSSNRAHSNNRCKFFLEVDTVKKSREILSKYEFAANEEPGLMSAYYNAQLEEALNRQTWQNSNAPIEAERGDYSNGANNLVPEKRKGPRERL